MDYDKADDEIEKAKKMEMPCAEFDSMMKAAEAAQMNKFFRTPELAAVRRIVEEMEQKEDDLEAQLKARELEIAM